MCRCGYSISLASLSPRRNVSYRSSCARTRAGRKDRARRRMKDREKSLARVVIYEPKKGGNAIVGADTRVHLLRIYNSSLGVGALPAADAEARGPANRSHLLLTASSLSLSHFFEEWMTTCYLTRERVRSPCNNSMCTQFSEFSENARTRCLNDKKMSAWFRWVRGD